MSASASASLKRVRFVDDHMSTIAIADNNQERSEIEAQPPMPINLDTIHSEITANRNYLSSIAERVQRIELNMGINGLRQLISECDEWIQIYNKLRSLAPTATAEEINAFSQIQAVKNRAINQINQNLQVDAKINPLTIEIFESEANAIIHERDNGDSPNPEVMSALKDIYSPLLELDLWRDVIASAKDDDLNNIRVQIKTYLKTCILSRRILCCGTRHHINQRKGHLPQLITHLDLDARIEMQTIEMFKEAANAIILDRGHGNFLNSEAESALEDIYLPLLRVDIWRQGIAQATDNDKREIRRKIKNHLSDCIQSKRTLCCKPEHRINTQKGRCGLIKAYELLGLIAPDSAEDI